MTITKAHITRRASSDGVSAKTVERDYVLTHAIAAIVGYDMQDKLAFKGGTALRLIHFQDYRYSADLDFSILNGTKEEALTLISKALQQPSSDTGPQMSVTGDDPPKIAYVGPLGRERRIKLDLADDEHVVHTEDLLPLIFMLSTAFERRSTRSGGTVNSPNTFQGPYPTSRRWSAASCALYGLQGSCDEAPGQQHPVTIGLRTSSTRLESSRFKKRRVHRPTLRAHGGPQKELRF